MADLVSARVWDVLVAGAGPAGCAAALYTALGGKSVLVLEKRAVGGGMLFSDAITDWPGEGAPIDGIALGERMRRQAEKAGAVFRYGEMTGICLSGHPFCHTAGEVHTAVFSGTPAPDGTRKQKKILWKTLILSTGSPPAAVCPYLSLSPEGTIPTDDRCRTAVPHIYAAGACRENACRRIVTACADGYRAAQDILQNKR